MADVTPPSGRRRPVHDAAEALRERVFATEPDARIGSLPDLARLLGVGITTVQQAARVLEHEGLLEVRRGPGGGYYGRRPDAAALERGLAAWMRMHPTSWGEALDITSLLFNELATAAAACTDEDLRGELRVLAARIVPNAGPGERLAFEAEFENLLFRMVNRPLFELLTKVTLALGETLGAAPRIEGGPQVEQWWLGRGRIIAAILDGDRELARFEADRWNRRFVMGMLPEERKG